MNQKNFVWVNPERLELAKENEQIDGVLLEVEISPYDVPQVVEGAYRDKDGVFRIDFRYIDHEPAAPRPKVFDKVKFFEGKSTKKLLAIELPVDEPTLKDVSVIQLKLRDALRRRSEGLDKSRVDQRLNQNAARAVIEQNLGQLVGVGPA